jgi:Mn-containing catalase
LTVWKSHSSRLVFIEPTPKLVDQFFNASTGGSQSGETDFVGPWNYAN